MNFTLSGEMDLEAPTAGSLSKFSLSMKIEPSSTRIILPFHARYPIANSTRLDPYASIIVRAPTLYRLSCFPQGNTLKPSCLCFFILTPQIVYSLADGSQFMNSAIYEIKIPCGTQHHRILVELGTSLVVWITAIYVYSVMFSVSRGRLTSRKDARLKAIFSKGN